MMGLAAARLATGPGAGPAGPWFAVAIGAAGAGLALWGFARLRRARAARPDLSWWGYLRAELVALGLAAALLPGWAALPPGQRDGVVQATREWFELVHVSRGRH
jgi:hypothetical protein